MDYFRSKRFLDTLPDWERGRPAEGPLEHYLPRVRAMLRRCGEPQARCRSVIVAGTNGKGTTASLLAALLQAARLRVGLYTSPHLHSQRERIQVDGAVLDKDAWAEGLTFLQDALHGFEEEGLGQYSRFEVLTVLAAHLFAASQVDVAIYEVGLGGRYDATNAWDHEVAVLTRVDLDHCHVLGHDVVGIADDKLQVARPGRPLFTTTAQRPEVLAHVRRYAADGGMPLWLCGDNGIAAPMHSVGAAATGVVPAGVGPAAAMVTAGAEATRADAAGAVPVAYLADPEPGAGRSGTWVENARLSLAVAAHLAPALAAETGRQVLAAHRWPGRFETARETPLVVLDGAHNPAAAAALCQDLQRLAPGPWVFVVGVNEDHEAAQVLTSLAPSASRFVLTCSEHPKAMAAEALAALAPAEVAQHIATTWRGAFDAITELTAAGQPLCVTGSLHLVARAREHFALPHEAEGISEDVPRESLECLCQACETLGLTTAPVTDDGNVMRVTGGRRPLLFYRNKHPFNDYVAARMAEDKGYQYELFVDAGLPVPFTMQVFSPYADDRFNRYKTHRTIDAMVADIGARMSWPVLVKKTRSSLSQGVYLEADAAGVAERLQSLFENAGFLDNLVLVQDWVEGPEYRVIATQGELLLVYAKVGEGRAQGDLNPLHHHGGRAERVTDPTLLSELAALTASVAQVVDLGFYAIDLIRDVRRGWQILELNPNPFCFFYNRSNGRGEFVAIYRNLLRKYAL